MFLKSQFLTQKQRNKTETILNGPKSKVFKLQRVFWFHSLSRFFFITDANGLGLIWPSYCLRIYICLAKSGSGSCSLLKPKTWFRIRYRIDNTGFNFGSTSNFATNFQSFSFSKPPILREHDNPKATLYLLESKYITFNPNVNLNDQNAPLF